MRSFTKSNFKIFFNHGERVNDKMKAIWDVSQSQISKCSTAVVKKWMIKLRQYEAFHKVKFQNFFQPWWRNEWHHWYQSEAFHNGAQRYILKIFFIHGVAVNGISRAIWPSQQDSTGQRFPWHIYGHIFPWAHSRTPRYLPWLKNILTFHVLKRFKRA